MEQGVRRLAEGPVNVHVGGPTVEADDRRFILVRAQDPLLLPPEGVHVCEAGAFAGPTNEPRGLGLAAAGAFDGAYPYVHGRLRVVHCGDR